MLPTRSRAARPVTLAALSVAAFALTVLPDFAAQRMDALAQRPTQPAVAPRVPGDGFIPGSLDLARQLAGTRLKRLGLVNVDAFALADAAIDAGAAGAPLADVSDRAYGLLETADAAEAVAYLQRLADVARATGSPAFPLAADLHALFGFTPGGDDVAAATGMRISSLEREAGLDLPGEAMEPLLNGVCQACPSFDFGCFDPLPSWQTHSSTISPRDTVPGADDCNWYCFNVELGESYEFKTCGPEGSATFDTSLELRVPTTSCVANVASNDDACLPSEASRLLWTSTLNGTIRLRVRDSSAAGLGGDYTLAYRRLCSNASTCNMPDGTLANPLTTCQTLTSFVDPCGGMRHYSITLVQGQTYTFTFCPMTCFGAGAAFDSRIDLLRSGMLQATSTSACGDDGEVVFTTDPLSGGGTYCVRVVSEGGADPGFTLGWRVACQAPSDAQIVPTLASTVEPDCTRTQTLSASVGGTGPFIFNWTIVPPPGGSADPSTFTSSSDDPADSVTPLLQGEGVYQVTVTVTNECGSDTETIAFTLEDRAGPDLQLTAEEVPCMSVAGVSRPVDRRAARRFHDPEDHGAPTTQSVAVEAAGPTLVGRDLAEEGARHVDALDLQAADVSGLLASALDDREIEERIAAKLGIAAHRVVVFSGDDPRFVTPPGGDAVSCGSPCMSGTLSASNPFYDVFMDCSNGAYSARTGAAHSVTVAAGGARQNVIFGGSGGSVGTSDIAFFVHETNTFILSPSGGSTCVFDPPDTATEPANVGVESEWTRSGGPGVDLRLREEIVAFGDVEDNSGVRLTLGMMNLASSTQTVHVGVRWQIDYQNAFDDGPHYAQVRCGPPFEVFNSRSTEHEFSDLEIADQDFYRIQNNTSSPIFGNFTNTAEIAGFPDTGVPDKLIYAVWSSVNEFGSWIYPADEGDPGPDSDSAVLYYFGAELADAIQLSPGQSFTRSVIIFTAGANQDCGAFRPGTCAPTAITVCPGSCVRLGANATDNCGAATVSFVSASPGAPPCAGNPCIVQFEDEGTFQYTWEATDDSGNVVTCSATVTVADTGDCNEPPTCDAGPGATSQCRVAPIEGASAEDPDQDPIGWSWVSDDPRVTITPATGVRPGGPGGTALPPVVAELAPDALPCAVTANLTLTVDDGQGGVSSCTTTVTFNDQTPPQLVGVPADVEAECDAVPGPAPVAAVDGCDGNPTLDFSETRADGDCPGRYTLTRTWTATDQCGNSTSATQIVVVVDTTPPTVSASGSLQSCIWPPNHWYVCYSAAEIGALVSVSDACGAVTFRVEGCASDQPDDAPESGSDWNGDGHTTEDCVVAPDGGICVRAERAGSGPTAQDGRHYGVTVVAVDECGNESEPVLVGAIHVPHDQSPRERDGCRNPTKTGCRELPCDDTPAAASTFGPRFP